MSFLKICIVAGSVACLFGAGSRSAMDGVFTKAQALRGQAVYREECGKCHAENLAGGEGSPSLVGEDFTTRWRNKTAFDIFETTRKTMPADDPSHLSRRQYADIVAYMLSVNDYPAGATELESTAEALREIRIDGKK